MSEMSADAADNIDIDRMLRSFGYDPEDPAVDHESLLEYCRDVFRQAREKRAVEAAPSEA